MASRGRRSRAHAAYFESYAVTNFADLGFAEVILRALAQENYVTPTPIQAQAIPALLQGRDLLGIAQTGTGKTAAFALPILQRLLEDRRRPAPNTTRVLVLAPTRELAAQIADSFRAYAQFARVSIGVIVGGVAHSPQIRMLAGGLDVLVATPGRLLDHVSSNHLRLESTRTIVLDEADHMLDLGFIVPIRKIVSRLPKDRQNLFFSATMPKEIASLADDMLRDPITVKVTPAATTAERVDQRVILVDGAAKRDVLLELFADRNFSRAIVFTRTKRGADRVAQHLDANGVGASAIHGNKSQNQRQRALEDFRSGRTRALVATDIAARGIDIDGVSHVVNFELPETPEAYVHRIGRTARAGATGAAVSLCDNSERSLLKQIERVTRQTLPITDRRSAPGSAAADSDAPRRPHEHRRTHQEPGRAARHPGKPAEHGRPPQQQQRRRAKPAAARRPDHSAPRSRASE
ncbi:DEAD/DEAH box helicase [Methylosinus sp. PW1]|uniref:DEAD/DEAH box helicase n=1 Tax=Methylosinus sp. PW1 TaxID=107636 RepID=UPI000565CE55